MPKINGRHYEVHGPEGAPPLLMVHGFMSSRSQWRANLPRLAGPFRPVLLELLGHGRSDAPAEDAPYEVSAYFETFEAIRESLGVESWHICGQSFGAALTLGYAIAHPERVRAQVFTNSSAGFRDHDAPEEAGRRRPRAERIRFEGLEAIRAQPMHPSNAKRFPEAIKAEMVADAEMLSPEGVARSIAVTIPKMGVRGKVHANRVPTLLVNGRWEKKFQPHADYAMRVMPHLERVDLEGGHSINVEQAEGFDAALLDFMAERV